MHANRVIEKVRQQGVVAFDRGSGTVLEERKFQEQRILTAVTCISRHPLRRPMPRFHFDIHEDSRLITDEDGQSFANIEGARKEAMLTGASIAREAFMAGSADHVIIDVREDQHAPCLKISITLEVEELAGD